MTVQYDTGTVYTFELRYGHTTPNDRFFPSYQSQVFDHWEMSGPFSESVAIELLAYTLSRNLAYIQVHRVFYREFTVNGSVWSAGDIRQFGATAPDYDHYPYKEPSVGVLYPGTASKPSARILPPSLAIRSELILEFPPAGRRMFTYLRHIHLDTCVTLVGRENNYYQDHLPYPATRIQAGSGWSKHHPNGLPGFLKGGALHGRQLMKHGRRGGTLWSSRVTGVDNHVVVLSSRFFSYRKHPY